VGLLWLLLANRGGSPPAVDLRAQAWLSAGPGSFLAVVAKLLDFFGRYYWIALAGGVVAFCAWAMHERRVAWGTAVILLGTGLWVELLKWAAGRDRPDRAGWLVEEGGKSFPSGHAACMTALCLLLIVLARRYLHGGVGRVAREALLVAIPLAVGLSRVTVGVHFITDVLAGWLLGAAWFCFGWWWVLRGEAARRKW
jgi:undecaprenyl-diphosphatase